MLGIEDVLKRSLRVDVKALGNLCNSFRSESTLGVYVSNFALSAAEFFRRLRDHRHCLGEPGFPQWNSPKALLMDMLAKPLCERGGWLA